MSQSAFTVWALLLVGCASVTLLLVVGKARVKQILSRFDKRARGACAHLGLATDPFSRYAEPTFEHRCYVYMHRDRIDLAHQERFCLTGAHVRCPFLVARPPNALEQAREHLPRLALERARDGWAQLPGLAGMVRAEGSLLARRSAARLRGAGRRAGASSVYAVRAGSRGAARRILHLQGAGFHVVQSAAHDVASGCQLVALAVWRRRTNLRLLAADVWAGMNGYAVGATRMATNGAGHSGRRATRAAVAAGTSFGHMMSERTLPGLWRALLAVWVKTLQCVLTVTGALRAHTSALSPRRAAMGTALSAEPADLHASAPTRQADVVVASAGQIDPTTAPVPAPAGMVLPPDPHAPGLLGRMAARHESLVEQGVAAMEAGREDEARVLFLRATELNPRSEVAWYWRAKTAETLSEVIASLERALDLQPANEQIRSNLDWARRRQQREGQLATAPAASGGYRPITRADFPMRRSVAGTLLGFALGLLRSVGACASVALGAGWILGGLPAALRQVVAQATNADLFAVLPVVSVSQVLGPAHLEILSGYDLFSAVPFAVGTLALLLAAGLVNREGWTRLWGPALALGSGWVWLGALGAPPTSLAAALCGLVALGGVAVRSPDYA